MDSFYYPKGNPKKIKWIYIPITKLNHYFYFKEVSTVGHKIGSALDSKVTFHLVAREKPNFFSFAK